MAVKQGDFVWILATTGGGEENHVYTFLIFFARETNWIALEVREEHMHFKK